MIKIKEIAFFAYAVTDMKKSRAFYEGVLGLKSNSEYGEPNSPDYVEYDIGPTTLSIGRAPGMWEPSSDGASAALEVEDFDQAVAEIQKAGVPIKMGPHDFPNCRMVVITDPDGNKITLHSRKKKRHSL
jgi:predicted enzyme related to lactoylglutathione lyase